jgi:hypothetical protein
MRRHHFVFRMAEFTFEVPDATLDVVAYNAQEAWALALMRAHSNFDGWSIKSMMLTNITEV